LLTKKDKVPADPSTKWKRGERKVVKQFRLDKVICIRCSTKWMDPLCGAKKVGVGVLVGVVYFANSEKGLFLFSFSFKLIS
jgi:hypothetical protein